MFKKENVKFVPARNWCWSKEGRVTPIQKLIRFAISWFICTAGGKSFFARDGTLFVSLSQKNDMWPKVTIPGAWLWWSWLQCLGGEVLRWKTRLWSSCSQTPSSWACCCRRCSNTSPPALCGTRIDKRWRRPSHLSTCRGWEGSVMVNDTHTSLMFFLANLISFIPSTHLPVFLSPWSRPLKGFMRR